jgi:nitrate/nitrite transporter NarK
VNAIGALGGFVAPNVKTWAEATFNSPAAGLYVLAGTTLVGAVLILALGALGLIGRIDTRAASIRA